MSEPLLTKRLHISGLTPSITAEDLERRFSLFGKVQAMDGFGARDALGDPRKFAFVTMDIGAKQLAKCLNVLSGSTWKGAKLRIAEARPDFRARLAQINSQPPRPAHPKRTRHGYGRPSSTLALTPLSAKAAASTPGWVATPSGRVVRPMRMRPQRPLEPMRSQVRTSNLKSDQVKVKKRVKPPPTRARRRLIDPTKWDSMYLGGVFLDALPLPSVVSKESGLTMHGISDEEDLDMEHDEGSISDNKSENEPSGADVCSTHEGLEGGAVLDEDVEMEEPRPPALQTTEPAPSTNLKALFAPREDASFSLLQHFDFDLDLELDADILGFNAPASSSQEIDPPSQPTLPDVVQIPATTSKTRSRVTLDPSHPLLFPLLDSLPHPYTPSDAMGTVHRNTPSCFLFPSTARSRDLRHLPASATFTRSCQDTSELIRERWEQDKSALTHEWKKALREARGSRRGGKGAGEEVVGGY